MQQFTRTQSTYCGNSPANKPENLTANLNRGAAPELADFIESFGLWVEWYNECNQHQGDGMNGQSPALVFDSLRTEKRVIPDAIRTVMFWKPSPLTKVGRNGVRCNLMTYELEPVHWRDWQGKEVSVRVDPSDVSRAAICAPDGSFICMASCNEKVPWNASNEQKSKAIAAIKRRNKLVREYHQARPKLHNNVAEEMWQQQAEESRRLREAAQPAVPLVTVSTPMNHQIGQIQRALDNTAPAAPPGLPRPKLIDMASFFDDQPEPVKPERQTPRFIYESEPQPEEEPLPSMREMMANHPLWQESPPDEEVSERDKFLELGAKFLAADDEAEK